MIRRFESLAIAAFTVLETAVASAQPAATDPSATSAPYETPAVVQARQAFRLGSDLARAGQWSDALGAFERSAELRRHPVTTYNVGYCERALGRYTRARQLLARALDEKADDGAPLPDDLATEARGYVAELNRKIGRVAVTVDPVGLAVSVDGRPLEALPSAAGRAVLVAGTRDAAGPERVPVPEFELLIDPGAHVFVLRRPGAADVVVERHVEPGETATLHLTMPTAERDARPHARVDSAPDHTWTIVSFGIGAAGVAVGSTFGLYALGKKAALDDLCPKDKRQCPEQSQGDIDAMDRFATISTIGFAVGGVGIALGTYLLLSGESRSSEARVGAWVRPGSAGLRGEF